MVQSPRPANSPAPAWPPVPPDVHFLPLAPGARGERSHPGGAHATCVRGSSVAPTLWLRFGQHPYRERPPSPGGVPCRAASGSRGLVSTPAVGGGWLAGVRGG